jgi:polyhydroxyalkanoate synthesis repressor PhaR
MESRKIVIKKYENRRLYDTSNSRYVNLDDIAQIVREGSEVRVIDAVSGEDLTRLVMTQIVVESAKEPDSGFPLDMLRQMVIASGKASREGLLGYMKTMFDMYQKAYRTFTPGIGPFDFEPPKADAAGGSAAAPAAGAETGESAASARSDSAGGVPRTPAPLAEQHSIDALNERIAELERLVLKQSKSRNAGDTRRKREIG